MEAKDIEIEYLAKRMFNAYGEHCGWKSWDGRPMPKWSVRDWPPGTPVNDCREINDAVRSHWIAAAAEAATVVLGRDPGPVEDGDIRIVSGRDIIARQVLASCEGRTTVRSVNLAATSRAFFALAPGDRFATATLCFHVAMLSVNLNHVMGAHRAAILAYLQAGGDREHTAIAEGDHTVISAPEATQ